MKPQTTCPPMRHDWKRVLTKRGEAYECQKCGLIDPPDTNEPKEKP